MEYWIAAQNIRRFRKRLFTETDPEKRRLLRELIESEMDKLQTDFPQMPTKH